MISIKITHLWIYLILINNLLFLHIRKYNKLLSAINKIQKEVHPWSISNGGGHSMRVLLQKAYSKWSNCTREWTFRVDVSLTSPDIDVIIPPFKWLTSSIILAVLSHYLIRSIVHFYPFRYIRSLPKVVPYPTLCFDNHSLTSSYLVWA